MNVLLIRGSFPLPQSDVRNGTLRFLALALGEIVWKRLREWAEQDSSLWAQRLGDGVLGHAAEPRRTSVPHVGHVKDFPSAVFCLKPRREPMQGSFSVKLFGEQERDQNKRNNKRPPPAGPSFMVHRALGTKAPRCVLSAADGADPALQPVSALKGHGSL